MLKGEYIMNIDMGNEVGCISKKENEVTWYYIVVTNYSKGGNCKTTIILNPQYTRDKIAEVMRKERVDEEFISKMQQEGIFQNRDITFTARKNGMILSWHSYENGKQGVYTMRKFAKNDTVTFHAKGTFSYKYSYTCLERIEILFEGIKEKLSSVCHKVAIKWRRMHEQNIG